MPGLEKIENKVVEDYVPDIEKLPHDQDDLLTEVQSLENRISPERKKIREKLKILSNYLRKDQTWVRKHTMNHAMIFF